MTDLEQAIANVKRLKSEAKESAAGYRARIAEARRAVFKATRAEMREDSRQVPLPLETPEKTDPVRHGEEMEAWAARLAEEALAADLEEHVPGLIRHAFVADTLCCAKGDLAPLCAITRCGKREEHRIHAPGPEAALAQAKKHLGASA